MSLPARLRQPSHPLGQAAQGGLHALRHRRDVADAEKRIWAMAPERLSVESPKRVALRKAAEAEGRMRRDTHPLRQARESLDFPAARPLASSAAVSILGGALALGIGIAVVGIILAALGALVLAGVGLRAALRHDDLYKSAGQALWEASGYGYVDVDARLLHCMSLLRSAPDRLRDLHATTDVVLSAHTVLDQAETLFEHYLAIQDTPGEARDQVFRRLVSLAASTDVLLVEAQRNAPNFFGAPSLLPEIKAHTRDMRSGWPTGLLKVRVPTEREAALACAAGAASLVLTDVVMPFLNRRRESR